MATYLERSLEKLKEFEGCVGWMYRDTVGKVTVGVGLMLPDAAAAAALPFRIGTRTAARGEIEAEFQRVAGMPAGRAAAAYRVAGGMELGEDTIEAKLRGMLEEFEGDLRRGLAGYDGFPEGVKLALLDMAYNLGPTGLLKGYPKMLAAVEAGAWAEAAACCLRHGPPAARNAWTREQFLSAVMGTIRAAAEIWWRRLVWGLVGMAASWWERGR